MLLRRRPSTPPPVYLLVLVVIPDIIILSPILHHPSSSSFSPSKSILQYHLVFIMAKHHPDLVMCRKQPGIAIGRLCEKHDGKCVICDSFVNPSTIVHTCDECNYGSFEGRCVVCGGVGVTDAYYCSECRYTIVFCLCVDCFRFIIGIVLISNLLIPLIFITI